ncbi:MAG: hypothetical protein ACLQGU_04330 [bacterium]
MATIDDVKKQKLFEDCEVIFAWLSKKFGAPDILINAVAAIGEESLMPTIDRESIAAFVLGFYLGFVGTKFITDTASRIVEGKGTTEEILFGLHLGELQSKLKAAGVLPIGQNSWMS